MSPASRWLASESAHIESEAGEHDLNVFQAIRPMYEIMVANFTAFHDLVSDKQYDLCHLAMLEGVPGGDGTTGLEPVTGERYPAASENWPVHCRAALGEVNYAVLAEGAVPVPLLCGLPAGRACGQGLGGAMVPEMGVGSSD